MINVNKLIIVNYYLFEQLILFERNVFELNYTD